MKSLDGPIRRVGFALIALLVLLIGQLGYLQLVRAGSLSRDPHNFRVTRREVQHARGLIITSDGVIIAESKPSNDDLQWLRVYPQGPLFAQITGYQSLIYGTTGIERTYNDVLLGREITKSAKGLDQLLAKDSVQNVRLTLSAAAQHAVERAVLAACVRVRHLPVQALRELLLREALDALRTSRARAHQRQQQALQTVHIAAVRERELRDVARDRVVRDGLAVDLDRQLHVG